MSPNFSLLSFRVIFHFYMIIGVQYHNSPIQILRTIYASLFSLTKKSSHISGGRTGRVRSKILQKMTIPKLYCSETPLWVSLNHPCKPGSFSVDKEHVELKLIRRCPSLQHLTTIVHLAERNFPAPAHPDLKKN